MPKFEVMYIVLLADTFTGMTMRGHCYLMHAVFFTIVVVLVKLVFLYYLAVVSAKLTVC